MMETIEGRFWRKVNKSGENGCWIWTANKSRGYGLISTKKYQSPKKAHRLSWEMHHGEIPEGLEVLHKCDNPSCVNPDHLFLGTQLDNIKDAVSKNRIGKNPKSLANLRPGERGVYGAGSKSNLELGRIGEM